MLLVTKIRKGDILILVTKLGGPYLFAKFHTPPPSFQVTVFAKRQQPR